MVNLEVSSEVRPIGTDPCGGVATVEREIFLLGWVICLFICFLCVRFICICICFDGSYKDYVEAGQRKMGRSRSTMRAVGLCVRGLRSRFLDDAGISDSVTK